MKSFLPLVFLPVGIESIEQHGPLSGIPVMACASVSISKIASCSLPLLQQFRLLPPPSLHHDFIRVALNVLQQHPRLPEIPCSFERLWSYTGRTVLDPVTRILVTSITFPLRFFFPTLFLLPTKSESLPSRRTPLFGYFLNCLFRNIRAESKTAQPER